ncbi:hypothetical protein ACLK2B_16975 [Escherichia coli]
MHAGGFAPLLSGSCRHSPAIGHLRPPAFLHQHQPALAAGAAVSRYLAHNGEINTIAGNRQWAKARSYKFATPLIPDLQEAAPFVNTTGSDSFPASTTCWISSWPVAWTCPVPCAC